jgi:hypothetical protein
MKVRKANTSLYDAGIGNELDTPEEIEREFDEDCDDTSSRSRRSLQVSMQVDLINLIKVTAALLNMSFSLIIREVLRPYLNIATVVLKKHDILNVYGNINKSVAGIKYDLSLQNTRIVILRSFVDECNKAGLDTSWIDKSIL